MQDHPVGCGDAGRKRSLYHPSRPACGRPPSAVVLGRQTRRPRNSVDTSLIVSTMALGFSVVAIIVSAVLTIRQLRLMQHSNLLPVIIDIFRESRAPEFREHLAYIETRLRDQHPPEKTSLSDMSEPAITHVRAVANFFGGVGILLANGVIDDVLATQLYGSSVLQAWYTLAPYIRNERSRRNDENVYLYFENLAYMVSQNPPSKLNARLNLHTMPE